MEKIKSFIFKHTWITVILVVFLTPVFMNYFLFTWHFPYIQGKLSNWMGFLSNYSGGIIGGLVAYFVAKIQIDQMRKQDVENSRSFLSACDVYYKVNEFGSDKIKELRRKKGKLLLTDDIQSILLGTIDNEKRLKASKGYYKRDPSGQQYTDSRIRCYSIIMVGNQDAVINCSINVVVGSDERFMQKDNIRCWVDIFEKGEELIIPLYSQKLNMIRPFIEKIEITYHTLKNEEINFVQSEVDQSQKYEKAGVDKVNSDDHIIFSVSKTKSKFKLIYKG